MREDTISLARWGNEIEGTLDGKELRDYRIEQMSCEMTEDTEIQTTIANES